MYKGKRIGLALGGGGARGIAHLGVLRNLKKNGIVPDVISGTSMGALIAIGYAQGGDFKNTHRSLRQFVIEFNDRFMEMNVVETSSCDSKGTLGKIKCKIDRNLQLLSFARKKFIADNTLLNDITDTFIKEQDINDLDTPTYICALDITSGHYQYFSEGSLKKAIIASMSIPGYFEGVHSEGRQFFDAQSIVPVPIQIFREVPVDILISVEVAEQVKGGFRASNAADVLFRQSEILYHHSISEVYNCSDVVIRPELNDIHWTDFKQLDCILKAGVIEAEKSIELIDYACENFQYDTLTRPWHLHGYETPTTSLRTHI
jgi:NTE family protein